MSASARASSEGNRPLWPCLVLLAATLAPGCASSDADPATSAQGGRNSPGGQGGSAAGSVGAGGKGEGGAGMSGASQAGAGGAGMAGAGGAGMAGVGGAGMAGVGGAAGSGIDPAAIGASCLSGGTKPIVRIGDQFPGAAWNDPSVMRVGETFVMYASAAAGFSSPVQIYRLSSDDGLGWTIGPSAPVLPMGKPGEWDEGGVETPSVVQFDGKWHLFYTGYKTNSAGEFRLGHATSEDGLVWTKDPSYLLGPSDPQASFYQYIVGEPGTVVLGDTLLVYFTAVGADLKLQTTLQVIGRITLAKGAASWSAPELVLAPDQAIFPRKDGYVGFSTPAAALLGGEVHLFVDLGFQPGMDYDQIALYHAHSPDGLSGWVFDPTPLRSKADFPWTQREIRAPWPLLSGTSLQLYFAGDNVLAAPADFGIGRMDCSLAP